MEVEPAVAEKYTELGGENGTLGAATGPQETVGDGVAVPFEGGTIYSSEATGAHVVQGEILRVYTEQGGPEGQFGFPTEDETEIPMGWSSTFTGGTITWTDQGGGEYAETLTPN
ncbi:mycolyltransferase [Rhodococcus rhodnii]|nr:mycolyltransferase [Rhodococcus rhodnii]